MSYTFTIIYEHVNGLECQYLVYIYNYICTRKWTRMSISRLHLQLYMYT